MGPMRDDVKPELSATAWSRLESLLVAVIELAPSARADFIARACADDSALGAELRALVAAHERAGLLDRPLVQRGVVGAAAHIVLSPGTVVAGRYEIGEQLGAGGMGVVYRARDLRLGRSIALKFLSPALGESAHAKQRFLAEARAAAALEHVNVCTVYEIGETETGQLFIAMAFIEGESLRRTMERGPLPAQRAVRIAQQIAAALECAHEHGIVHRDVKPANIMMAVDDTVKLVDFGVAKLEGATWTGGGTPGTTAYMSPEQVRGESVDQRTDVWALGIVLYEMLVGRRPFTGDNDAATVHAITTDAPVAPTTVDATIPRALDDLVSRALTKDRNRRFPSARAMKNALRDVETLVASPPAQRPRLARGTVVLLATAAVALVVAGSLVATAAWRRAVTRRAIEAIPRIEQFAERGRYVEAYALATEVERVLPDDSTLRRLMPVVSDRITVVSDPAGARVWLRQIRDDGSLTPDSTLAGVTPLREVRVARADYRLDIRKTGLAPVARIASSALNRAEASLGVSTVVTVDLTMRELAQVPGGMVFVPGSRYALVGREAPTRDSVSLSDFYIDTYEVTNAQFREFVVAGGYSDARFWKHPFVLDGRVLPRSEAMKLLVDRTGLPGPREWSGQEFPPHEARRPVTGVSWYEAAAYAEFAGKRLPSIFEWEKAAREGRYTHFEQMVMPWGLADPTRGIARRANFGSTGTHPVDGHPGGISPYGVYNMAGNVEEWVSNPIEGKRLVTGGAWDDPMYVFANFLPVSGFHASPSLGFRCARSAINAADKNSSDLPIPAGAGTPEYQPVDDATFRTLLRHYAYDRAPLDSAIVTRTMTADWTRETIRIAGPWRDHTLLYLYLPLRARRPLETIVFVPGVNTFYEASLPDETERIMGPHIKAGRAVMTVLFKGMVGRPWDANHVVPPASSVQYRQELVTHSIELRRALDYLTTRADLDSSRFAYVGFSKGSGSWLPFAGVERRFRSVVLVGGGIDERFLSALPEASSVNFAPRINAPTLLLNGRYDEEHPWVSRGLPLWRLLREPKRLSIVEGGHLPHLEARVPAINRWLDETLGGPRR